MPHTRKTLALTDGWDITLDSVGGIAVQNTATATAQNVANEARLFTNDAYFQQDKGIPYFVVALGHKVAPSVLRSYLREAAFRVADVQEVLSITVVDFDPVTRTISGDIQFTTKASSGNTTATASF